MTETQKKNPVAIENMFNGIASRYDKANALMSFNMHHLWNRTLAQSILSNGNPEKYLDLCSGTGEIAKNLLERCSTPCEAFLLDFSEKMLECSKPKLDFLQAKGHRLHYLHADALKVPLPSNTMDAVTIAYGIRNVTDPAKCAAEAWRVLKTGGTFAILELTIPKNPLMRFGHTLYLKTMLPLIGKAVASNKEAYRYLSQSVQSFIPPEELEATLKSQGFRDTTRRPLSGGIATLLTGRK